MRKNLLIAFYITFAAIPGSADAATLYVARRGWHTDVGFAVAELAPPLNAVAGQYPGANWVFFGFGDRRYLQSKHRGSAALSAALLPGPGLMLVTGLREAPSAAFGADRVLLFDLDAERAMSAQREVWAAFRGDAQASLTQRNAGIPGPYSGSLFFEASPRYSAAHTCNTWVAEILAAADVPVHPRRIVFAGQLWRQLKIARGAASESQAAALSRAAP